MHRSVALTAAAVLTGLGLGHAVQVVQVVSRSGSIAHIGAHYEHGYHMAMMEFEAQGGLWWRGEKVDLLGSVKTVDDESSASAGANKLRRELEATPSVEESPVVVLGGYGSTRVEAELDVTDEFGVLFVNGGGASSVMYKPRSTAGGKNDKRMGFGLLSSVSRLASTTLDYMMQKMDEGKLARPSRLALIWEDSSHGEAYRATVAQYALRHPSYFRIDYAADYPYSGREEVPDFERLVLDLYMRHRSLADGINCLLVDAHSEDFVALHDAVTERGLVFDFVTYGARGTDGNDVMALKHPESAENIVSAQWWNPSLNSSASRKFVREWRRSVAFEWADALDELVLAGESAALFELPSEQLGLSWYGALAAQTARTLLAALNTSAVQTASGVRDHLLARTFTNTILPGGLLRFNAYGQADYEHTLVQGVVDYDKVSETYAMAAHTLYPESEQSGQFKAVHGWKLPPPPCSNAFVNMLMGPCDNDSTHTVYFVYVDRAGFECEPPGRPCDCSNKTSFRLPPNVTVACDHVELTSHTGILVITFAVLGALTCLFSLAVLLVHYNHVVMRAGQREFLAVMCIAGLWCNLAAVSFLGPNVTHMCITRVFSLMMSITLLIGALTVKVYRIYKIWNNSSMRRIVITSKDMFKLLALIMLGIMIIFVVWAAVQTPVQAVRQVSIGLGERWIYEATVCDYDGGQQVFPFVSIGYVLLILLICNVLSFQGRNSDSKYMESRSIWFASYCLTFIGLLVTILIFSADLPESSIILLVGLSLVFASMIFVGLLLGPKVYFTTRPGLREATSIIRRHLNTGGKNSSSVPTNNENTNDTRDDVARVNVDDEDDEDEDGENVGDGGISLAVQVS